MKRLIFTLSLLLASSNVFSDELTDTIAKLDRALFTAANEGDLDGVKQYFSPDLEFYHDTGGLDDYEGTIDNLARMFANINRPIRTLVPGSMEVFPIKNYGAIQKGRHTFCNTESGKPDCGTFGFVHIWQKNEGAWKITRVVSYGH